jgi:hypothetical protein
MRKLTTSEEAVLRTIRDDPGCRPDGETGREAFALKRLGLVAQDPDSFHTTAQIGYRITDAGRKYLNQG